MPTDSRSTTRGGYPAASIRQTRRFPRSKRPLSPSFPELQVLFHARGSALWRLHQNDRVRPANVGWAATEKEKLQTTGQRPFANQTSIARQPRREKSAKLHKPQVVTPWIRLQW